MAKYFSCFSSAQRTFNAQPVYFAAFTVPIFVCDKFFSVLAMLSLYFKELPGISFSVANTGSNTSAWELLAHQPMPPCWGGASVCSGSINDLFLALPSILTVAEINTTRVWRTLWAMDTTSEQAVTQEKVEVLPVLGPGHGSSGALLIVWCR